ncbi:MAG: acetyl-CoA hydrolase/transferase C-terminal domain-containing protein [Oscillospiraceae bacterium]
MYSDRILLPQGETLLMTAEDAAAQFSSGMTIALGGFSTGIPKAIPISMARRKDLSDISLICAAARGADEFSEVAKSGVVSRFNGFQFVSEMRKSIDRGEIIYSDFHLGQLATKVRGGVLGKIDFAVIECCKINADGSLVPSIAAGISDALVEQAENILIEINLSCPLALEGFHDFCPGSLAPISSVTERLGNNYIPCPPSKIRGIVITELSEENIRFRDTTPLYDSIAENVLRLVKSEIASGHIPENFVFQSGVGGVANAMLEGFGKGGFKNLRMYSEILANTAFGFIKSGMICEASTTTMDLSLEALGEFYRNIDFYKPRIVIRPLEISNGLAQIQSIVDLAINTAVETDIYGNVNSTNSLGSHMLYGIGGSNDFARNSKIGIFITPSTAKDGKVSCIVPMVSHVDSTEHDVDVIVTEFGFADLRGKSPKERASLIIENCAHPDFRDGLYDYYEGALDVCGPCQTPHDLTKALSWHRRFLETGSMREQN